MVLLMIYTGIIDVGHLLHQMSECDYIRKFLKDLIPEGATSVGSEVF